MFGLQPIRATTESFAKNKYGQEIRICAREKLLEAAFCVALFCVSALVNILHCIFMFSTFLYYPACRHMRDCKQGSASEIL